MRDNEGVRIRDELIEEYFTNSGTYSGVEFPVGNLYIHFLSEFDFTVLGPHDRRLVSAGRTLLSVVRSVGT